MTIEIKSLNNAGVDRPYYYTCLKRGVTCVCMGGVIGGRG